MLTRIAVAVVLSAALVAAGSAAAAGHQGTLVDLHTTSLGKVLSTSKGLTLYLYTPDPKGKSVCSASCATIWPPLLTKGKPIAGKGVKQTLLGTTRRSNGTREVTYAGHPLYLYTGDTKAGQTTGQGVDGIWYAVSAAGKKVAKSQTGGGGTY